MTLPSIFFQHLEHGQHLLHGHHDHLLMLLSIVVAILISGFALQVAGLVRVADSQQTRQLAVLSGSLVLGGGIWAMHFIGMLAFDLGVPVRFHPVLTLFSMIPAILASWLALEIMAASNPSLRRLLAGGSLIGLGIGVMHYLGMLAMEMPALLRFEPLWFGASLLVAPGLASAALWTHFRLRENASLSPVLATMVGGSCMGLAIAAMHYTGMAAARFVASNALGTAMIEEDKTVLGLSIGLGILLLALIVALTNGFLRYHLLMARMRDSENRLRAIVNTAVDGIITIDARGKIQSFNQAAETLFGWRADEVTGKNINILMPPPYHDQHDSYLRHYLAGGQPQVIGKSREVMAQRKNGEQFPIRLGVGETRIHHQPFFVGFVTDISARRAMEQSLRDSEQQYSSLIANIPGTTFRCLPEDNWPMLFISHAVENLTGWAPEEFISGRQHIGQLIHVEDRARLHTEIMNNLAAQKSYECHYRIVRRDGAERWINERASATFDEHGKPLWIDGVMLDITDTRLRNAEFESTVKAISRAQAVVEFSLQGLVLSMNPKARQLFGREQQASFGHRWHSLFAQPEMLETAWDRLLKGEHQQGEYRLSETCGTERWIQAFFNPILDADGKPLKIILLATDLSERRQMVIALEQARDRAEQAAEAKSAFLANMSHEIRTPMNAIIGFTEVLLDSPLQPEQYQHLRTVDRSARSLLRLLNDILDTAKLDRGAIELEQQDFNLRELCQELIDVLQLQAGNKGLSLSLDYQASRDWFKGDPLRIHQILMNLSSNAVKFTDNGSVTLAVRESEGLVCIDVRDTGIGIDTDRQEHIFAPFAQADATMTRRFGGTGLGTTIARQLTELMGGHIQLASEVGLGSTFSVYLPLVAGNKKVMESSTPKRELPALRILVADDVTENLELLRLLLTRQGHEVILAHNGEQALSLQIANPADLILMDVQMPVMDGHEATRRIRAHESAQGLARTPIIALTASVLEQDRELARQAGMDGFAQKPLDWPQLLNEIHALLVNGHSAVDALPARGAPHQVIDWDDALQRWSDKDMLETALRRFLDAALDDVNEALDIQNAGGDSQASALGHRLSGAAANLGLQQVAQAACSLDSCSSDERSAALISLSGCLARARNEIRLPALAVSGEQAQVQVLTDTETQQQLLHMIAQLERGEIPDHAPDSLRHWLSPQISDALIQSIADFDHERALDLLRPLLDMTPEKEST